MICVKAGETRRGGERVSTSSSYTSIQWERERPSKEILVKRGKMKSEKEELEREREREMGAVTLRV